MLLEALVACAGVTLKSVATAVEIPLEDRQRHRRRRSRFSRHARRRQGSPGRLRRNPPALRGRHRRAAGQARPAAETHRALLRGLPDHQERPEGFGVDEAGVSSSCFTRPLRGRVDRAQSARRGGADGLSISDSARVDSLSPHPVTHRCDACRPAPSRVRVKRPHMSPDLAFILLRSRFAWRSPRRSWCRRPSSPSVRAR